MTKPTIHDDLHANRRGRRWCLTDLVTDHVTGKMRETAVFSVLTKAAVLWAYVVNVGTGNFELMTSVVAVTLLGHEIGSRVMNLKTQQEVAKESK